MGRDWRFRAPRRKLQYGLNLLACDAEFLDELIYPHVLQILKDCRNRRSCSAKHHSTTPLARNALHGGAFRPV